eukprot:9704524-Ditylum_brightwellii.AAC.1
MEGIFWGNDESDDNDKILSSLNCRCVMAKRDMYNSDRSCKTRGDVSSSFPIITRAIRFALFHAFPIVLRPPGEEEGGVGLMKDTTVRLMVADLCDL